MEAPLLRLQPGGGKTGPVMPVSDHSGPNCRNEGVGSLPGPGGEKKADPKGDD